MNNFFEDEGNVWHEEPDDDKEIDNVFLILRAIKGPGCDLIIQNCYAGGIRAKDASEVLEYLSDDAPVELVKALQYAKCNVQFI